MFAAMLAAISWLLSLGFTVAAPPRFHSGPTHNPLLASTTSGQIYGKIDPAVPAVRQFLGIPYAVPPVGDKRWAAPQALHQPQAHIEATQLPPSCMQYLNPQGASVYTRDDLQFNLQGLNGTGSVSEDCLTLSVWTPLHAAENSSDHGRRGSKGKPSESNALPVFIFFYGGSFVTGGEDVPYQIPAQWVQRTQEHIVLSFNYRLNIFGFPNAAGLEDQNVGLLDQRAAVEWAQKNIAAFGGDPDRIVLWGQSAGSISVDYYNFAYPEDPIVSGLIMDSGTAQTEFVVSPDTKVVITDTKHTNFTFVAEHVGCDGLSDDPPAQLSCMRGVDAKQIEQFVAQYQESGASPGIVFMPVQDNSVIFANYTERALQGQQANIPAIIGTNTQDGVPFAPYSPNGPNETLVEQALLTTFFCPATQSARLRQQTGRLTYRYLYAGDFGNVSPEPWMGAFHASELPMLMGTHPDFRGPSSPLEYATSQAMQDAYLAFAKDPRGGLAGQAWQSYAALGATEVREFGAGVAAQDVSIAAEEAKCNGNIPAPAYIVS